jgi:GT2 family glycosyltransferase
MVWAASVVLAPMLVVAIWNVASAPRLHWWAPRDHGPSVSVLVPARDEAGNLRVLLPALLRTRYPALEVLVLDDGSRDETAAVARGFASSDERVRLVEGLELPDGWTGKNWACHQLTRHAHGRLLVFCDADVVPGPDAVGRTVTALMATGAGALTAIPRDRSGSCLARGVVPLVASVPVAALLPLMLVPRVSSAAVSMGNGQWFAWRRETYDRVGGHHAVRSDVLEDVRLARRVKAAGERLLVVAAPRDLVVRMYGSAKALREGFGKNLYLLLGAHPAAAAGMVGIFLLAMAVPVALPLLPGASPASAIPLAMLLGVRLAAAILFGEGPGRLMTHPVAVPVAAALAVDSFRSHRQGSVTWKRRRIGTEAGS